LSATKRTGLRSLRHRSERRLGELPLVSVAFGPDPESGEEKGTAHGVIALGDRAHGFLALGAEATGVIALGARATGIVAMGGRACSQAWTWTVPTLSKAA
jgi:hypothetical protein